MNALLCYRNGCVQDGDMGETPDVEPVKTQIWEGRAWTGLVEDGGK